MAVTGFNHWPQIANNLHKGLARTVKKVTLDFQKDARSFAAVDTGFMRDNIYVSGAWGSDYGQDAASTSLSKKPKSQFKTQAYLTREVFPEIQAPPDEFTAYIASAAAYSIYSNYGTRFQAAQPFWEPALDIAIVNLDGQLAIVAATLGATVSGSVEDI